MDPWDAIRKAASDRSSGSVAIAARGAAGLRALGSRREVLRAGRALVRAHPAMAAVWRLVGVALERPGQAGPIDEYIERLRVNSDAAADGLRWVVGRRATTLATHSSSSAVFAAVQRAGPGVRRVVCTASLPGGEGRALARKLSRASVETSVVEDAAIGGALREVDVAVVGADAVTETAIVNKVGTLPFALVARELGVPVYAVAASDKLIPDRLVADPGERFEAVPLGLFDAVLTERGPTRGPAIRRAVSRITLPAALERLAR